jgi:hypothetical protein
MSSGISYITDSYTSKLPSDSHTHYTSKVNKLQNLTMKDGIFKVAYIVEVTNIEKCETRQL